MLGPDMSMGTFAETSLHRWKVNVPHLKRVPVVFAMKYLRAAAAAAAVGGEEAVL